MNRRRTYISTAALLMGASLAGASRGDIALRAATANTGGKTEVRLRWTITEGWFTDGAAFNVYRVENGQRKKLNGAPIKAADPAATPTLNVAGRQFKYGEMLTKARLHPAGVAEKELFSIRAMPQAQSSAAVFDAMKTTVQSIKATSGPGLTSAQFKAKVQANPTVGAYSTKLRSMITIGAPKTPPTAADVTRMARTNLILGAMIHQSVGKTLGLAYDDGTAVNGAKYTYALRMVAASGAEAATDSATVDITVGADPQPAAPAGLTALQFDADRVDFRWTRLSTDEVKPFGLASYNLYRVDPAHPQGVKVNDVPIVIGDIPTANGHVEPQSFAHDPDAPVGALTYKLTMTDSFGRESQPTSLPFTMEDWHTPLPLRNASAELLSPNVTVAWLASDEADVKYKVYRIDTEQKNAAPQLLTAQPIAGDPYNPNAGKFRRLATHVSSVNTQITQLQQIMAKAPAPAAPEKLNIQAINATKLLYGEAKQWSAIKFRAPVWLQYVDQNAPKDHYYRYLVTAAFTRNNRDSAPAATSVVAVPQDAKPIPPANLKSDFAKAAAAPAPSADPFGGESQGTAIKASVSKLKANGHAFLLAGRAQDTGGVVNLHWDPVPNQTGPVIYKIYRANATGYFPSTSQPDPAPTPSAESQAGGGQTVAQAIRKNGFVLDTQPRKISPIQIKPGLTFRYIEKLSAILRPSYALIGQVTDRTSFSDAMPRSHANYYMYRVEAINRWGVPGDASELSVRVPATLAPSVPSVMAAFPAADGSVSVQIRQNPADEEVVRYHVLRKPIPMKFALEGVAGVGKAAHEFVVQGPAQPAPPDPSPNEKLVAVNPGLRSATTGRVGETATKVTETARITEIAKTPVNQVALQGTAKVTIPARPVSKASVTLNGQSLIASGIVADQVGAGASRFGIIRASSGLSDALKFDASGKAVISQALLELLDLIGYEEVGVADAKTADSGGLVTFSDSKAEPQREYAYRVVAEDSDTLRSGASTVLDGSANKVKADPPTGVSAALSGGGVKITWGIPKDAKGYIVERALSSDNKFIQISGILTTTSFTDFSPFPHRAYLYRVRALDSTGNVSDPAPAAAPVNVP